MIQQNVPPPSTLLQLPASFERSEHTRTDILHERERLAAKLARKKNKVVQLVGAVKKTGYNHEQEYRFVEEAEVVRVMRSALAKAGLSLAVTTSEITLMNTIKTAVGELSNYTIKMLFILVDTETGFSQSYPWLAMGSDQTDKALYKAYTSGVKYFLLKNFLLPTDDDVERDAGGPKVPHQNRTNDTPPGLPPMDETSARIMAALEEHFRKLVPPGARFDQNRFHGAVWDYFGSWPSVNAAAKRIKEAIDVKETLIWG
jgi:hypothetical protein